ncbi:hypothetical protein ABZZ16_07010 [Streptomyces sp. NPDC006386]
MTSPVGATRSASHLATVPLPEPMSRHRQPVVTPVSASRAKVIVS